MVSTVCPKCAIAQLLEHLKTSDPLARKGRSGGLLAFCDESLRVVMQQNLELCSSHRPPPEQEIAKLQTVLDAMAQSGLLKKR
jgi:hypothetical protein